MLEFFVRMKDLGSKHEQIDQSKFRFNKILSKKEERIKCKKAIVAKFINRIWSTFEELVATKTEKDHEIEEKQVPIHLVSLAIQNHDEHTQIAELKEVVTPLEEASLEEESIERYTINRDS